MPATSSTQLSNAQLLDQLEPSALLIVGYIEQIPPVEASATSAATRPLLTALIGFSGDHNGMLLLHCSRSSARRLATGVLGNSNDCDEELGSTLGEMVRMLGCDLKQALCKRQSGTLLSLPTVLQTTDQLCNELMRRTGGELRCYGPASDSMTVGLCLHDNWRPLLQGLPLTANLS